MARRTFCRNCYGQVRRRDWTREDVRVDRQGRADLEPGVPESFKVLVKELQSLGLAVEVLNDEEEKDLEFARRCIRRANPHSL